jgi:hypothetical protein
VSLCVTLAEGLRSCSELEQEAAQHGFTVL